MSITKEKTMPNLRSIQQKTKGQRRGFITNLFSPGDIGNDLKPFVLLDHVKLDMNESFGFPFHPHSGIATVTYELDVDVAYTDTEGREGVLKAQGMEWMNAGGGAWHRGTILAKGHVTGFQLWLALPPGIEDGPSESLYIAPADVPQVGSVKVLLGEYEGVHSPLKTPSSVNYFDLHLKKSQFFNFSIPPDHRVAWVFVYEGSAVVNQTITQKELLVLGTSGDLEIKGESDCRLLIGTAVPHPYPLINGGSSVHTNKVSLIRGHQKIAEIGQRLQNEGKILEN
jgi:redox-sensitive bicupin YhaK (pirin superfamily)